MVKFTNEAIIQCLVDYYNTTNKVPTCNLTASQLGISPIVIRQRFGSWNDALTAANLPITIKLPPITIQCHNCGKYITVRQCNISVSGNNFCSRSCATITNNTTRIHTSESKTKRSATLKQKIRPIKSKIEHSLICAECGGGFIAENKHRILCSMECMKIRNSRLMSIWLVSNRKHIRGPHQQSYMEHSFEQWLISHNYTNSLSGYLMEVRFFNPDTKKNGWADFVFPKLKLIIELDGSHHKKRKQLDDIRDDYLTGRGWKVVRVTHREYQSQQKLPEIKQLLHIP